MLVSETKKGVTELLVLNTHPHTSGLEDIKSLLALVVLVQNIRNRRVLWVKTTFCSFLSLAQVKRHGCLSSQLTGSRLFSACICCLSLPSERKLLKSRDCVWSPAVAPVPGGEGDTHEAPGWGVTVVIHRNVKS